MIQKSKSVSSMSNEGRNAYVIEHINEALLGLLKEKSLNEISISEICETAGVGRMSFYRNYENKEDVIKKQLLQLIQEWEKDYEGKNDPTYFSESLLRHYYKHKDFIMKIGLVLEGGAMRGMFTAGVLDTFLDNDIKMDSVVGVSAGALFGVNYLSGQKGRVIRYNKRFNKDKNYMGFRPLLREGNIVSTKYAYEDVPKTLDPFDDETYKKSNVPFYAVITNVATGNPEYIQIHSVFEQMDTLRASGSMPFVSKPVAIGDKKYLDGGIADSIPFEWLAGQGCDKLIVILTRDMEYRKKLMSPVLVKLYGRKYPKIAERLLQRHNNYNRAVEELRKWEAGGKAMVIRPSSPIEIGRIEKNPDKLQAVYELGAKDGNANLQKIKDFIK